MNNLFRQITDWKMKFTTHKLYGTDEYDFTVLARKIPNFIFPMYYSLCSHDRLEQHLPEPKLSMKKDGSLWELFIDKEQPDWPHRRNFFGREIPYFHFIRSKCWPKFYD